MWQLKLTSHVRGEFGEKGGCQGQQRLRSGLGIHGLAFGFQAHTLTLCATVFTVGGQALHSLPEMGLTAWPGHLGEGSRGMMSHRALGLAAALTGVGKAGSPGAGPGFGAQRTAG